MSLEPQRPYETVHGWASRVATAFVGINEEQELLSLIEMMAKRHKFNLSNDEFAAGICSWCGHGQPCDGAMTVAMFSKLHWLMQAAAKQ